MPDVAEMAESVAHRYVVLRPHLDERQRRLLLGVLDTGQYPTGLRYTKQDVDALPLTRYDFHGGRNYTLHPPDTP